MTSGRKIRTYMSYEIDGMVRIKITRIPFTTNNLKHQYSETKKISILVETIPFKAYSGDI